MFIARGPVLVASYICLNRVKIKSSYALIVQVLIPVANGTQEIELVTVVDILRRANVDVVIASVGRSKKILASRGTKIVADELIKDAAESIYDLIILPVRQLYFSFHIMIRHSAVFPPQFF